MLLGEWSAGVVNKLPTLISFSFLYFVVAALGFYSRSVALPFSSSSFQVRCCHVIVLLSSLCLCQFSTVEEEHCCHVTLDYTLHFPHSPCPSLFLFPGSQLYHSVVCVLVQFLMLRLMGRTVTAILCSFTFQMVRFYWVYLCTASFLAGTKL